MALISLAPPELSNRPCRLPGSPHWADDWKLAVSNLRTAVGNAKHHAKKRSRYTVDQVGTEVIDVVNQLDSQALAVLHVLIGELVRLSRKVDH